MKILYAPWRHDFVVNYKNAINSGKRMKGNCIFCEKFRHQDDKEHLILKRLEKCGIIMNTYPYSVGHLMVLPYNHVSKLKDLEPEVRSELMEAISMCTSLVEQVLKCDGINVGINLGGAAGAGIPDHLHIHVLPRWERDVGFLTTIGQTALICSDLYVVYDDLKSWLDRH